jgi:hypothetical protein
MMNPSRFATVSLYAVALGAFAWTPAHSAGVQPAASKVIVLAQAPAPEETLQDRVAQLKAWLKASQDQLRAYQWIETTTITVNGEQKSQVEKRCYYGADGTLEKVTLESSPGGSDGLPGILPPGRLIHRIEEHKKQEMEQYLQNAEKLVHDYIPPTQDRIQQSVNSGNMSMQMLDPGHEVGLEFGDYLMPNDKLGVKIELPDNRLLGVSVSTFLVDQENGNQDPISMDVTMSVLPDGTIYAQKTVLNAPARNVVVTVENAGYQRLAP